MSPQELRMLIDRVERVCLTRLSLAQTRLHGLDHLREVAELAGQIVCESGGTDAQIEQAVVAGYLHDAGRVDDGAGNAHAHASADLAGRILGDLFPALPAETICRAIRTHADGQRSDDLVTGALWDADRLTLGRAGIALRLEFFSTRAGRRRAEALLTRQAGLDPSC